MHTTEDEHLLDLARAQALERPGEQGNTTEREEDARLVETQHLKAAVVRVSKDNRLEGSLVDIVAALLFWLACPALD